MPSVKDSAELPREGTLHTVNQAFHQRYKTRKDALRAAVKAGEYQIVVRIDDSLITSVGSKSQEYSVVGEQYHEIKAWSHLPLLLAYTEDVEEILQFTNALYDHQDQPFSRQLIDIIEQWVATGSANTLRELSSLKTALQPVFAEAMDNVAKNEIEKTVKALNHIKAHSVLPMDKTFFIVMGSHQARYKQLGKMIIKQWFTRQFDCYGHVDHHVRYCEGGKSVDDALELVCTALADVELAHLFLGEQYALNQDVVTQTAERHLQQFWPDDA